MREVRSGRSNGILVSAIENTVVTTTGTIAAATAISATGATEAAKDTHQILPHVHSVKS